MAATTPFIPIYSSLGKTVAVVSGSTSGSVAGTITTTNAPSLLVTNAGPNVAWVRMSAEAVPVATAADVPMLGNTVRLFANPVPFGTTGVAVIVSVTTSPNTVYFTPGQGGI